jgi:hypothetical protein
MYAETFGPVHTNTVLGPSCKWKYLGTCTSSFSLTTTYFDCYEEENGSVNPLKVAVWGTSSMHWTYVGGNPAKSSPMYDMLAFLKSKDKMGLNKLPFPNK